MRDFYGKPHNDFNEGSNLIEESVRGPIRYPIPITPFSPPHKIWESEEFVPHPPHRRKKEIIRKSNMRRLLDWLADKILSKRKKGK